MAKTKSVNATPTKTLFVDVITRDIDIKSCILDMIDNSVDSYVRKKINSKRKVKLKINPNVFEIYDSCGGIELKELENNVFRFGASVLSRDSPTLGVYGIGLKRALLKIGKFIELETDDGKTKSQVTLDVDKWMNDKNSWDIPLIENKSDLKDGIGYTKIKITNLNPNIKEKFALDSFVNTITQAIHVTYAKFSKEKIDFEVNGKKVPIFDIQIRSDENYAPERLDDKHNNVDIKIICFIDKNSSRSENFKQYTVKRGWNIFCNDRLVVADDTSSDTGWTGEKSQLPKYHNIFHEFRGFVFLSSNDPINLPLNTSKDGLDMDTEIYNYVLNKMIKTARPIISFLSGKYRSEKEAIEEAETQVEEEIKKESSVKSGNYVSLDDVQEGSSFKAPEKKKKTKNDVSIQYKVKKESFEKAKSLLGVTSKKEVGLKTFDYYLDMEDN